MQKYTKLQLLLLEDEVQRVMSDELTQSNQKMASRGLSMSGANIQAVIQIGKKHIDYYIQKIIACEKAALPKNSPENPERYFTDLKKEIIDLVNLKFDFIFSTVQNICPNYNKIQVSAKKNVEALKESTFDLIRGNIDVLQEELNLDILSPPSRDSIRVEGSVGVLNTGQIKGNIEVNLNSLSSPESEDFKKAIQQILDSCQNSEESDEIKCKQMENIDFLVEQSKTPDSDRKKGQIESANMYLSSFNNLSGILKEYGPVILKFFGM